jgi:hypothetical protein
MPAALGRVIGSDIHAANNFSHEPVIGGVKIEV